MHDFSALVATPQGLLFIASDGEVTLAQEPYAAIGSGTVFAMGAMTAFHNFAQDDYDFVGADYSLAKIGALVAIRLDPHCGGEVQLKETSAAQGQECAA